MKVVQGKKSISWANSVLPVFIATLSGSKSARLPEPASNVQIDTTFYHPQSRSNTGFHANETLFRLKFQGQKQE
jgi:hypothetical protein